MHDLGVLFQSTALVEPSGCPTGAQLNPAGTAACAIETCQICLGLKGGGRANLASVRVGGSVLGPTVCAPRWWRKRGSSPGVATCVYNAPGRRVDAAPDGAGSPVHWKTLQDCLIVTDYADGRPMDSVIHELFERVGSVGMLVLGRGSRRHFNRYLGRKRAILCVQGR